MKNRLWILLFPVLVIPGCGSPAPETTVPAVEGPPQNSSMADHSLGLNNSIHIDDAIRNAWSGATIQVEEIATTEKREFDIDLGDTIALGETGLVLEAKVFIPDFTMDEGGISSSTAEPINPALQVVITDVSGEKYDGWLFAAMPEIHPYTHSRYSVILLKGIHAAQ